MSIIKCNVLFFENKCWQIFYGVPQDYNKIIAHELLHFIFIDYFNKYIVEQKLKDNCWMISEVFNDVILNTSEFKEIIKSAEELGYYDHEEIFKRMFRE
jgi:predicted SprT family Zn-dependent metalloprotease